jgi:hypothetical protein
MDPNVSPKLSIADATEDIGHGAWYVGNIGDRVLAADCPRRSQQQQCSGRTHCSCAEAALSMLV